MNETYLIQGPITREIINPFLDTLANDPLAGGHSVFMGQVRADDTVTSRVTAIEYSAYDPMVKAEADKIINEVSVTYSDVRHIRLLHSTGIVKAGEISLFVLVSAGHRRHAIDACNMLVELLKERLPVWKKEILEDSSHTWKYNDPA